jgi:hypothetical protein
MPESNSIMPPEFILTRGEAYSYYLAHIHFSHDVIIKNLILNTNTPLKEPSFIQNNAPVCDQLSTAINTASTELTKFIRNVKQRCIKSTRAIKDRKPIFSLSDYPLLRKEWNGVLLKHTSEGTQTQYLNLFNGEQYDATMADVKMISSDGITFLMNKLYLASASKMLRNVFADVVPILDDGAVILIQTNVPSDELKSVVQFIMFGQIDCDEKCPNNCKAEAVFKLLNDFGIDLNGNSITLSHSKTSGEPQKELLQFNVDQSKDIQNDGIFNLKTEREIDLFDESHAKPFSTNHFISGIQTAQVEQFNEYAVNPVEYSNRDLLMPPVPISGTSTIAFGGLSNYTDIMTGIEMERMVKQEIDSFLPSDDSIDSQESTGSMTNRGKPKRKRKLGTKKTIRGKTTKKRKKKEISATDQPKTKGSSKEQKPFMELSREGQKARVGDFFDRFLKESQILGISDGSFAGYLGYRATIDGEPWVASTFKWLHEGITVEEKLKDRENQSSNPPAVSQSGGSENVTDQQQNLPIKPRPPFLDLTHEEKIDQVGDFFDLFLEKSDQLQISSACFAAYLGMKVTYVTDRLAASTFSKLYDGSDKREKWRFSLGPKEVKCVACGKKFQGEKMTFLSIRLKGHMKTVHPTFDFKCITCGEPVETWEEHVKHSNDFHTGEMKMQCNSCDLIFNSRAEIRSHKLTHHTSSRPEIVCAECGKKLTPASMEVHMKTEHGQEHVACPKCPKILKHPIALERHLKTNHDECQCEECGKVCNSATGLKRHMLTTHTPDSLKVKQKLRRTVLTGDIFFAPIKRNIILKN